MSARTETFDEARAKLADAGYVDLVDHEWLQVGVGVHHAGQQYVEAYWDGTATVLAVMEKSPSAWAMRWRQPDIEVIVERDKPLMPDWASKIGTWADYHCRKPIGRPEIFKATAR